MRNAGIFSANRFAAMGSYEENPWLVNFMAKLLEGDHAVLRLLEENQFPGQPPRNLRAPLFLYRFTTPAERAQTGAWWKRELRVHGRAGQFSVISVRVSKAFGHCIVEQVGGIAC